MRSVHQAMACDPLTPRADTLGAQAAALRIQTLVRGHFSRKVSRSFQKEREHAFQRERERAATAIQSVARGRTARRLVSTSVPRQGPRPLNKSAPAGFRFRTDEDESFIKAPANLHPTLLDGSDARAPVVVPPSKGTARPLPRSSKLLVVPAPPARTAPARRPSDAAAQTNGLASR